ncbi:hypothetical protein [Pseudoalteromonas sp. MelDa3]|uniref:hypothetical protein n=1 Tax=Pseudoalteromonas sp. MelDa3 TaxID=888435 RepID=UPI000CB9084E|nr:hypothetical protein [Pseudoalteromonas sp. MelDa3]PLT26685.1 hypothetical protein CXF89_03775 [Pseudoalteromonas sp. MelDa3]
MTASAGAWYRVGKVNVTNDNQSVVGVDTNWQSDVIAIAIGDIFTLDAKTWYEVTAVNSDTSITLDRGFEGSTGTNKTYAIVRNTSGTILTRIAGQVSVQFNQKQLFLDELRTWLNSDNASEELTDSHGLKQSLKTPSQMVRDHDEKLAELDTIHPYPYAMRKVEFEARRAVNNEKFAASGFVHFGKHYGEENINQGMYVNPTAAVLSRAQVLHLGRNDTAPSGTSKTDVPVITVAGVITKLLVADRGYSVGAWDRDSFIVKLPPAEDGTRTYDSATGISVTHATPAIAFASETDTNKVVTDRVDMWGFEAFLREINDADPFVYANGLIQSQSANIDGVTTVTDNVRPATYFAWYEGDSSSAGKGVNWQTATEAQRISIASDPENNIYFDDATGKFYQWCVRGRSFAGAGNGDWNGLGNDPTQTSGALLSTNTRLVTPIGASNGDFESLPFWTANVDAYRYHTNSQFVVDRSQSRYAGLFIAKHLNLVDISTKAANGECYFLVCGTVNRLNQGAYHPSYNPLGSGSYLGETSTGNMDWYEIDANKHSQLNCFTFTDYSLKTPEDTGKTTFHHGSPWGRIGGYSGRPDGRYYDVIYASGQGGVCRDMRYSAWGLTQEDFAEADLKVKSGEYRGTERLFTTRIFSQVTPSTEVNSTETSYGRVPITTEMFDTLASLGLTSTYQNSKATCYIYNPSKGTIALVEKIFDYTGGPTVLIFKFFNSTNALDFETYAPEIIKLAETSQGQTPASASSSSSKASDKSDDFVSRGDELYFFVVAPTGASLSSEFNMTEVIGDPANILQCDDLKDGWVGSWSPTIPDGSGNRFPLTRKVTSSTNILCSYSSNLGDTWLETNSAFNLLESSNSIAHPTLFATGNVAVFQHQALANQTESTPNAEPFGHLQGLGLVFATSRNQVQTGAAWVQSLVGKVPVGSTVSSAGKDQSYLGLTNVQFGGGLDLLIGANTLTTQHTPLDIYAGSVGVKALNYNVVENQQGFINYAYTELKYDGDWGDDSKIHIADNQTTMLDTNGNTVKVGTARIVEPLGWIKNDK